MKLQHAAFASIGVAFGVIGTLFILWLQNILIFGPPPPVRDSPVTVRGGSVVIRGASCNQSQTTCTIPLGEAANRIVLHGVDLIKSGSDPGDQDNSPMSVTINPSKNWIITLSFRDSSGSREDRHKQLKLCTSDAQCQSTAGSVGDSLYLLGDGSGAFSSLTHRDRDGARYDLTAACAADTNPGHGSPCNHIHTVIVQTAANPTGARYHCIDGECTISIGK